MIEMFYGESYKETEEPMSSVVVRTAFGAWVGVFAVFIVLRIAGMVDESMKLYAPMFLFSGVMLGALLYGKKHGGDSVAD